MPGQFPGKSLTKLSVLCNDEQSNGGTENIIETPTDTTANFICPFCTQTFEVHGWMRVVVEGGPLLFVSARGIAPRCPDDIFTLLMIDEDGMKYGGPIG